jgi:TPP-dependent pyruvate/acetoin dehydrogenase alpha subunit
MKGHAEHDAQHYVDPAELAAWRDRDPIERWSRTLQARSIASAGDLAGIDAEIAKLVDVQLDAAERAPSPAPPSALDGVYAETRPASEPYFLRYAEGKR